MFNKIQITSENGKTRILLDDVDVSRGTTYVSFVHDSDKGGSPKMELKTSIEKQENAQTKIITEEIRDALGIRTIARMEE